MLARRLLLAFWAGTLVAVAALVAPTLFAVLADRHLAGSVAGAVFARVTLASIALGVALAGLRLRAGGDRARHEAGQALAPAAVLALSDYAIRPLIESARTAGAGAAREFAIWHGVSSALYVLATALVIGLLVRELRR